MLDADIVIFNPDVSGYINTRETYQGKPSLTEDTSFSLTENTRRWREELLTAVNADKTVVVMMTAAQSVVVDTGQRQYSGTGRNRQTTRIVSNFEPFSAIPADLGTVVRKTGTRMKPVGDLGMLANYWSEFGGYSRYEVYLDGFKSKSRIVTETGDKPVAAVLRPKNSRGVLVLLPPPDLELAAKGAKESLIALATKKSSDKRGAAVAGEGALDAKAREIVASKFVAAVLGIDKSAKAETEITPPPAWVNDKEFVLAQEEPVNAQLAANEQEIAQLRTAREQLLGRLNEAKRLKALLFEKGKPLELAILQALNLLGYKAQPYEAGDSEFDAVFVGPDGRRLLGEAEGKDERAINIDKLDQLDRNLREDFQRPEVKEYAKGVLFGNAHRFTRPAERGPSFTEKCLIGAKRSGVALVRTADLFDVARHLQDHNDPEFALACRNAILGAIGVIVEFPPLPALPQEPDIIFCPGTGAEFAKGILKRARAPAPHEQSRSLDFAFRFAKRTERLRSG